MKEESSPLTMGQERLRSDRRQLGGMLLAMGVCVTFQPLTGMDSLMGFSPEWDGTTFGRIWVICCGIVQIIFGSLAMVVGYLSLVHDYGNRRLTAALIILTQLSWIPFVTGLVQVGVAASEPYTVDTKVSTSDGVVFLEEYVANPFVPEDYLPNKNDVLFLGCMGILGLVSYGVGFFGSLAFLEFALYSFDAGKPKSRDARYYRGRLLFYSFVILIAGMSQILFGAYILFEFGGGRLSPPIEVAMYRVSFPEITVAVGSIQMIVGYYGVGNYLRLFAVGPNDNNFQILALAGWLLQLILQYIVQMGFVEGNENSAALTSLALYSLGINILPAFLDYKMRTTPNPLHDEFYEAISGGEEIRIDISAGVASPASPTKPLRVEEDVILENLKTLEIHKRPDENSGIDEKIDRESDNEVDKDSSDSAEMQRLIEHDDASQPETLPSDEKSESVSSQPRKKGIFSRLFSRRSDRGEQVKNMQNLEDSDSKLVEEMDDSEEPLRKTVKTIEHPNEPGITVEEIVEYPMDFGITVEETVEYPDNSGAPINNTAGPFLEPGITVEEYIEYPDELSPENIFQRRTREQAGHDSDNDDDDTPPRSNESFSTDMGDTWGDQARQQMLLSPTEEANSRRIVFGEQKERRRPEGQESSFSREPMLPPQDFDTRGPKNTVYPQSPVVNPNIPDAYYDYDSDEGFEISEATPDDDTAALDAKIDKLKGELVSNTNLESYLNQIL